MSEYRLTVGMEIHVELSTKTKMFCSCKNDPFFSESNTNVCPVCYALPGALPVINKKAVAMVISFGQALKAETSKKTFWARKNYFYPDLPKGYQISQSTEPLIVGGTVSVKGKEYHLNHAHLEEDAGKLMHAPDKSSSLVNYNRAGVPLLEIVTEPEFHSAEEAKQFCQELQRIMRTLQISSADMEKGQMRCEANISVSTTEELGTKVEVKNINSFQSVSKAIDYEFQRQVEALQSNQSITQQTRTWNEMEGKTISMRTKETSADYRYFPEPDLPWVAISQLANSPEVILPEEQRQELLALGLHNEVVQAITDKNGFHLIRHLSSRNRDLAVEASKLFLAIPDFAKLSEENQLELLNQRKKNGWPNDTTAKVAAKSLADDLSITEAAKDFIHEGDLGPVIEQIIIKNPGAVADFKAGKDAAFHYLVGQVMATTKGTANIQQVREELSRAL